MSAFPSTLTSTLSRSPFSDAAWRPPAAPSTAPPSPSAAPPSHRRPRHPRCPRVAHGPAGRRRHRWLRRPRHRRYRRQRRCRRPPGPGWRRPSGRPALPPGGAGVRRPAGAVDDVVALVEAAVLHRVGVGVGVEALVDQHALVAEGLGRRVDREDVRAHGCVDRRGDVGVGRDGQVDRGGGVDGQVDVGVQVEDRDDLLVGERGGSLGGELASESPCCSLVIVCLPLVPAGRASSVMRTPTGARENQTRQESRRSDCQGLLGRRH